MGGNERFRIGGKEKRQKAGTSATAEAAEDNDERITLAGVLTVSVCHYGLAGCLIWG